MCGILLKESTLISSSTCVNDGATCKVDIKAISTNKQSVLPLQLFVCLDYKNPNNNKTIEEVSKITINTIYELIALYCSIVPNRKTIYNTSCILYNIKFNNDIELSPYCNGSLSIIVPTEQRKHVRLPALGLVEVDLLSNEISEWLKHQVCKAASGGNYNCIFIADKDFIPRVVYDTSLTDYIRSAIVSNVEGDKLFPIYVAYNFIASLAKIPSGVCCVYKLTDIDSFNHYIRCFKKGNSTLIKSIKDLSDKIDINVITYSDGILKTITDYSEMDDELKRKVLPMGGLWRVYKYSSDCINRHAIPQDNGPVEDNIDKEPVTKGVTDMPLNDNNTVEQAINDLNHQLTEIELMIENASKFQLDNGKDIPSFDCKTHGLVDEIPSFRTPTTDPRFGMNEKTVPEDTRATILIPSYHLKPEYICCQPTYDNNGVAGNAFYLAYVYKHFTKLCYIEECADDIDYKNIDIDKVPTCITFENDSGFLLGKLIPSIKKALGDKDKVVVNIQPDDGSPAVPFKIDMFTSFLLLQVNTYILRLRNQ